MPFLHGFNRIYRYSHLMYIILAYTLERCCCSRSGTIFSSGRKAFSDFTSWKLH